MGVKRTGRPVASTHKKPKSKTTKDGRPMPKPPVGKANQTTKAERLFRLRVVEEAILAGKRGGEIAEALATVGRVVPMRTIGDYIRAIRIKWEQEDRLFSGVTRARQLRELYGSLEEMRAHKAWNAWLGAQKLIADLEGNILPDAKPEHAPSAEFEGWSIQELDAYIESAGKVEPEWIAKAREAGRSKANGKDPDEALLGQAEPGETLH